jgi:hypothetical protein
MDLPTTNEKEPAMRRITCLCLALVLCSLAVPALAEEAVEPQAAPPVDAVQAELPFELLDAGAGQSGCDAPQATADLGTPEPVFLAGEPCGGIICPKGKYCCNPSCNICVLPGMSCTQQSCN